MGVYKTQEDVRTPSTSSSLLEDQSKSDWHDTDVTAGSSSPETTLTMRSFSLLLLVSVTLTWSLVVLNGVTSTPALMAQLQQSPAPFSDAYTAPSAFPTDAFTSYYVAPTGMTQEPRPAVTKYGSGGYFSVSVDQPFPLQTGAPSAEAVYPKAKGKPPSSPSSYASQIQANISALIDEGSSSSTPACQRCIHALQLGQQLAQRSPRSVPDVLIALCTRYNYTSTRSGLSQAEVCKRTYSGATLGAQLTQLLSYADLQGDMPSDGRYICAYIVGAKSGCPVPPPIDLHANGFLDDWFGGKHERHAIRKRNARVDERRHHNRHPSSAKTLRVLHFSDIHVDPRFFVGAEAACTSGQCCRSDSFNSTLAAGPPSPPGAHLAAANISEPAVYWGNYKCDSPWSLAVSAMESVTHLNGGKPVDMSLYTGDMVTHDADWHLSNDLITYTQQAIFDTMKHFLGHGPVFSAIGNHDTAPSDQASPHSLPDKGPRNEFSYDWRNLQRLFQAEGWFTHAEAEQVSRHYGGYSVSPRKGLRIITLNTDFWYKANRYNLIHSTNPDNAGILRFLTDELAKAERRGERVWIVGHVLTGWDGTNPLANPTNLFYQIVDHYAPRTIAHIFFGHTHEDQFNVFYAHNGTQRSTHLAKAVSFMAPSVTPGSNVNSAVRIYSVDAETYEVMDYDQFYTQVADFPALPSTQHGPIWQHLYSARATYGTFNASAVSNTVGNGTVRLTDNNTWPSNAPLNATFWSALTDEMEKRPELVTTFHHFQGRNSPRTKSCNSTCIAANICYMRSGSAPLGLQCPQGFGSVQS